MPDASTRRRATWVLFGFLAAALVALVAVGLGMSPQRAGDLERGPGEAATSPAELRGSGVAPPPLPQASSGRDVATPDAAPGVDVDLPAVEGSTRWQRRLLAGSGLRALESHLSRHPDQAPAIEARALDLQVHLLPFHEEGGRAIDSQRRLSEAHAQRPGLLLEGGLIFPGWTEPRRDLESFRLATRPEVQDPLGEGALLRVWTREGRLESAALTEAKALLERLDAVGGGTDRLGFDVVATPLRGREVFGESVPMLVAGYFASADDLSVIGTAYEARFVRILLRHELTHAWMARRVGAWQSRFLEEGLAEYLSRLEPHDYQLSVPPDRVRDELALLLSLLERAERLGVRWADLQPAALLGLSPAQLYAMGHLGYLLALAAMAYVGGDEIATALRSRSEEVLASALRVLTLPELLAFLRAEALGGNPGAALLVRDAYASDLGDLEAGRHAGLARLLRSLGVRIPPGWDDASLALLLRPSVDLPSDDGARVAAVAERLLGPQSPRPLVVVDGTGALAHPFRLAEPRATGPGGLSAAALDVTTRQEFVGALLAEAARLRDGEGALLAAERARVVATSWPIAAEGEVWSGGDLPSFLARPEHEGRGAIVLVASREALRSQVAERLAELGDEAPVAADDPRVGEILVALYAAELARTQARPAAVLVIDLADGDGDAWALARAFAEHLEHGDVAYWNPQQPLR